ncbi:MAG: glycosyltransferase, exosortase A system-associated [Chromatiales bacterium 21-64-14]|nr:MAG: glycosyltransferase, exosortase A system-associated [Chromatiales bacterium 21-64-14]HQU16074.1 glycosyltransferase, exosortase A system-associated [Gammaproteobacteria bacterium]
MRILHILDHSLPLQSGYTFRTCAILNQQRARGWETLHLTGPKHYGATALEEEVDGWRFYRTPAVAGISRRLPVIGQWAVIGALTRRLLQVVGEVRPDVLHAHSPALNGMAALRVARSLGIPLVYEVRAFWEDAAVDHGTSREGGLRYRLTRALETYVLRRADAVTTICEGLRGDILARGVDAERVTVVPNAVDTDRFDGAVADDGALRARLGLGGATVFGFIGSFYAYEGLDLLIAAMPRIVQVVPDARLLLVGGGPEAERLKTRAAAAGIAERVIFTGRVHHSEVERYYQLVDVFVYPRHSMRLTELVTPLKPLEAMAHGGLVVASDVGGHRELIRDGETGRLFRAGDPAALAGAVVGLLQDRNRWPEQRRVARAFIESERTWSRVVGRYEAVYAAAMARRSR